MNESVDILRERLLADDAVREVIARRAYEIYEELGSQPGDELEHWLEAENEILAYLIAGQSERVGISTPSLTQPALKEAVAGQTASSDTDPGRSGRRKAAG